MISVLWYKPCMTLSQPQFVCQFFVIVGRHNKTETVFFNAHTVLGTTFLQKTHAKHW